MQDLKDLSKLAEAKDLTAEFDPQDIEQNKTMAILAYLSILILIPIFMAKESKFAKFHVNQGILLAIVSVILSAALGILGRIPVVGLIVSIAGAVIGLAMLALMIIGIMNAANGRAKKLPVIGEVKFLDLQL